MRPLFGLQDTRNNGEDFALTPYIFLVFGEPIKLTTGKANAFGFGICWGWSAFYATIGYGIPKGYPTFRNMGRKVN